MLNQNYTPTEEPPMIFFDFSEGFEEADFPDVLDLAAMRSVENLRRFAKGAVSDRQQWADDELIESLHVDTIQALQKIPGGVAWWKQNKPVIAAHPDGVIEVFVDEEAEAEAHNKKIEAQMAAIQLELDAVTEELEGLEADRPGMRNFPQRTYDELIEKHDDLSRRFVELERSL